MTAVAVVTRPLRRQRLRFQYQAAYFLTAFFVVALAIASLVSPSSSSSSSNASSNYHDRHLADNNDDNDIDYTSYSCIDLFDTVPDYGQEQCRFAKSCNQGQGVFLSSIFCSKHFSYKVWCGILSPILLLWMVMLFRMLGSTAEDYFSPALEMFSVKLGLPPRFAGVSLLALGNGAADVSATRNAMLSDIQNGYLMSLGALTGAAMFIGAVVAGIIIIVSDGVPCRGALVRDVAALLITSIVVLINLQAGTIGPASISLYTTMYLVFVAIVMVADIYHRAVVLPRLDRNTNAQEIQRQQDESQRAAEVAGDALNDMAANQETEAPQEPPRGIFSTMMTALSNYDNTTADEQQPAGWGVESDNIINERPIVLRGAHGILSGDPQQHPEDQEPSVGNYAILEDGIDHICVEPGMGGFSAHNWRGAWVDGLYELQMELYDKWKELVEDEDAPVWEKALLRCEFPFTIFRQLSVPIPCEGYYTRSMVAASLVLSPVWFAFYVWNQHDLNIFWNPPFFYFHFGICLVLGALILRYAPGGDGVMNLKMATPLALYGFVVAATWIDWIADHLVALLEFLGIVCRIPGPILGLTILAWGNSMGDLSANMTMARKGLANMAMVS